jgi:hypothetical protein
MLTGVSNAEKIQMGCSSKMSYVRGFSGVLTSYVERFSRVSWVCCHRRVTVVQVI